MDKNYLLNNNISKSLYFEVAAGLPLIDYHNHLNAADIAGRKRFDDIAEAWLLADPYKHRAMRICGVDEYYITGGADRHEKFLRWCSTVPMLAGNPLYDWSNIEMENLLGEAVPVNGENAEELWRRANERLAGDGYDASGLFHRFRVEYAAPCARLTDELGIFSADSTLAPSLRGDELLLPDADTVRSMEKKSGMRVTDADSYMECISSLLDGFARAGCRFSDHSLDSGFVYCRAAAGADALFARRLAGEVLDAEQSAQLQSMLLVRLADEYARRGWTMQLHIGALRSTSTRLRTLCGKAGGYAGIGSCTDIRALAAMLDDMEQQRHGLPRTVIYNLNPSDNAAVAVLSGSFIGATQGPAWWWCDHIRGMREMLDEFSTFSVLSTFVGMNTDSRSVLSLGRHDYFRRVFCGWAGEKAERGELPHDMQLLGELTKAVCYGNAKKLISDL